MQRYIIFSNKTKIFFKKIAFSFGGSNYFRIFAPVNKKQ